MKLLKTVLTGLYGVWCILGVVLIFTGAVPLYCLPAIGLFFCALSALNGKGGLATTSVAYLSSIVLALAFPLAVYLVTSSEYQAQTSSRVVAVLLIFGAMGMLTMFSLLFSNNEPNVR